MKPAIAIAAFGLAIVGCTGDIGTMEEGAAGKSTYNSSVSPLMRSQCATCHEGNGSGPAFLGASGSTDDYTSLLSNSRVVGNFMPAMALIITKGPHAGAQWWTPESVTKISDWLQEEAEDFGPGGGLDVMAAWAACMTKENWNDSKMALWAQKQTDQGAACGGCHADGEYNFHANPTSDLMLNQQKTAIGIGSFFQVSAASQTPEVVPSISKLRSKCSGANLHPACAVDDQYVEYLERFYHLTRAQMLAGTCAPAGYLDPNAPPMMPMQ